MTSYKFGDVVLVHFPQSGVTARKQRPGVVVLDIGDSDIVIAPVTSIARTQPGDLTVTDLSGTGLIRPSWLRMAKVATLLKSDLKPIRKPPAEGGQSQFAPKTPQIWDSPRRFSDRLLVRPIGRLTQADRSLVAQQWQTLFARFVS